nr:immunoglobulin heavy chain junction region [Macaca mulatta]
CARGGGLPPYDFW